MPYQKKHYRRKPKKTYKKRSGLSFEKKVKKIVQGQAEKKFSAGNPGVYVFSANNNVNPVPLSLVSQDAGGIGTIFNSVQGAGRIGNKINVTKATLKILVTPNGILFPCILQVMIGTVRGNKMTAPSSGELDEIYQDGNETQGFDASRLQLLRSVNRDLFTIHRYMQIKVGPAAASNVLSNNDFSFMTKKTINLKSLLGTWTWNDVDNQPVNKELFIWCNWVAANTGSETTADPSLDFYTVIEYTDI